MVRASPVGHAVLAAVVAIGCGDASHNARDGNAIAAVTCAPGVAAQVDSGTTVTLDQSSDYSCVHVAEPTGVVLRPDTGGMARWPDPGYAIAVDKQGGIYSSSLSGGPTVIAWNADGTFKQIVGREGNGPGEMSGFFVYPFISPSGLLYVRATGKWLFFSGKGEFVREVRTDFRADHPTLTAILDDGRILSSSALVGESDRWFHVFDPTAGKVTSFGDGISPLEDSLRKERVDRPIAYAGADRFWAAPTDGAGKGYVLELWSINGYRIRTLKRDVPWFPASRSLRSPPIRSESHSENEIEHSSHDPVQPRPTSRITAIHIDTTGLLHVQLSMVGERWKWIPNRKERLEKHHSMVDKYLEVIDPEAGVVLASSGPSIVGWGDDLAYVPGTSLGYQSSQDSSGFYSYRFLRVYLKPRRD